MKYLPELGFYVFKRAYFKAEKIHSRLSKEKTSISLIVEMNKTGGSLQCKIPEENAIEFAVAMSKFLLTDSPMFYKAILDFLKILDNLPEYHEFLEATKKALDDVAISPLDIKQNQNRLRSDEVFNEMARNILLANDIDAIEYKKKLENDGSYHLKLFLMQNYCLDSFKLIHNLVCYLDKHKISPPHDEKEYCCIYCKSKEGPFRNVEHVVPESIKEETILLPRGFVCDNCNHAFSILEKKFIESTPVSFLLSFFCGLNKKGKYHEARFDNIHIRKKSPNYVEFRNQGKKDQMKITKLGDGQVSVKTPPVQGKVDSQNIARVLMKMAIGCLWRIKDKEYVLNERFDAARKYMLNGGKFNNRLILYKKSDETQMGHFKMELIESEDMEFYINIYGAQFRIGIEEKNPIKITDELVKSALIWDLWKNDKGPHYGRNPPK